MSTKGLIAIAVVIVVSSMSLGANLVNFKTCAMVNEDIFDYRLFVDVGGNPTLEDHKEYLNNVLYAEDNNCEK